MKQNKKKRYLIENQIAEIICVSFIGSRLVERIAAAYMAIKRGACLVKCMLAEYPNDHASDECNLNSHKNGFFFVRSLFIRSFVIVENMCRSKAC